MARKKTDAEKTGVEKTDAEQAEEILAGLGGLPESPDAEADASQVEAKTQMQEMVEALAAPPPKMPDEMPGEDRLVYIWSQVLHGDASFEPPTDAPKKRQVIQIPDDAVFLSTRQGSRVKLANGKFMDAKEVLAMAGRGIGGFLAIGASISHKAGQIH